MVKENRELEENWSCAHGGRSTHELTTLLTRELMSSKAHRFPKTIFIFQPSYYEINTYWRRFINIDMFISLQDMTVISSYKVC